MSKYVAIKSIPKTHFQVKNSKMLFCVHISGYILKTDNKNYLWAKVSQTSFFLSACPILISLAFSFPLVAGTVKEPKRNKIDLFVQNIFSL
jgi:hypothetical protein